MKKTAWMSLALAAVLTVSLSGCAMTPQKLLPKVRTALEKTPCTAGVSESATALTASISDASLQLNIDAKSEIEVQPDPLVTHSKLTTSLAMDDNVMELKNETYEVSEEQGCSLYTYSEDSGWSKVHESDAVVNPLDVLPLLNDEMTLDEELTEYNGAKVHCLVGTVSGETLKGALSGAMIDLTEGVNIDWSQISADVRIIVDAKTSLPVRSELTVTGLTDVLKDAVGRQISGLMDVLLLDLTLEDMTIVVDYTSYEASAGITLPEEAAEATEAA